MGDKQAYDERQQAESSQVEVKALSQPLQPAVVLLRLQFEVNRNISRQRPWLAGHQQSRQLPRRVQQPLGMADIDHDHAGRQCRLQDHGWQQLPFAVAHRCPTLCAQLPQGVWPGPRLPGRADERLHIECLRLHTGNAAGRRQAQRVDAQQAHAARGLPRQAQAPFQHGRYWPTLLAQLHVKPLVEALTVARH